MTEDVIKERSEKVKDWLKDRYNLLFALLIIFTIAIRFYYFSLTANQPTWWDEGDYLSLAKEFALPSIDVPEWWIHFTNMRPLLMSFVWAVFIRFDISEAIMRLLTEIVPSILLVIYTYLFASSMFNKKIGLVAGFMTSVYWGIQFYGLRFLTDIPAMLFAVICVYYFWEYYVKREKAYGLYLCIFLGVLGFLTRFPTALVTFSVLLYLLIVKRYRFFTDKKIWIAGFIGILTLAPYFIFNKVYYGKWFPAAAFYGSENITTYKSPAWWLIKSIPEFLGWPLTLFILIGIAYSIFKMVIGADIFWKQRNTSLNPHYLIFIWIVLHVYYFVFSIKTGNDRWILIWMPPLFIYAGIGLEKVGNLLKPFTKYSGAILILVILLWTGFFAQDSQMKHSDQLIKIKLDSYKEVKDTGLWLKDNTPENSKILGASVVQHSYYSHRRTYDFGLGNEVQVQKLNTIRDPQGRLIDITYESITNETEFECKLIRIKPDYLVLHPFEPGFTPKFILNETSSYPDRHRDIFTPLVSFQRGGQTTAVIYKFTGYPEINDSLVNCAQVYRRPEPFSNLTLDIRDPYRYAIPK